MTIFEIARIYTDLVNLDERVPQGEHIAKDEIGTLRTKYHQLLMEKFQEEGIDFYDRFDATRKAFEIVNNEARLKVSQSTLKDLRKTGT